MKYILLLFLVMAISAPVLGSDDNAPIKVKGVLDSPYTAPYADPPDRVLPLDYLFEDQAKSERRRHR